METITAIIISLILISILFFSLRSTVKRIDINTKKYFIDKLQDYDYLIEEKKKILDELNHQIDSNRDIIKTQEKPVEDTNYNKSSEYHSQYSIPQYKDDDLLKKYKYIKEKFCFDKESLISDFIKNIDKNVDYDYQTLVDIRKQFSTQEIYKIMKLQKREQKKYIYNMLGSKNIEVLEKYIKISDIKINTFIIKLDTILEKNDPLIYVYTSEKNENYDYISPLIKTKYDETINEGLKINYKGNLYDYSL